MNQFHKDHDDEDDEAKTEDGWGWWMVLPIVAGLIVYQIADAAMTSVFDEDD